MATNNTQWIRKSMKGHSLRRTRGSHGSVPSLSTLKEDSSSSCSGAAPEEWERDVALFDSGVGTARKVCSEVQRSIRRSGSKFQAPDAWLHTESQRLAVASYFLALMFRDYRYLYVILVVILGHVGLILLKWFNFYMDDEVVQLCIMSWGKYVTQVHNESCRWLSEKHRPGWGTAVSIYAKYSINNSVVERSERKTQHREDRLGYKILEKFNDGFPTASMRGQTSTR